MWNSTVGNAEMAEGTEWVISSDYFSLFTDRVSVREETFFYALGCCFTDI